MDFYQIYSSGGPGVKNGPAAGVLGLKMNILKIFFFFLQNLSTQLLEIWYVALPGALLQNSNVQMKVPGSKMAPDQGGGS